MTTNALIPTDQRTITFYDDELTAIVVGTGEQTTVYVPVRPICEFLGVNWSGQRQRINRDAVLSGEMTACVVVTTTQGQPDQKREMACLPLDFVSGFLFGISAGRVRPEIRERLVRYQRECYRVLAEAFTGPMPATGQGSETIATLVQVREMGRAIMQMAEEQIEFERRLTTTEGRLDQAATVVGNLTRRVSSLEGRIAPGQPVTLAQASQISQAVKAIAIKMGEKSGRNEFGGVYGELYRRFDVTSYKLLPAGQFNTAIKFLTDWYVSVAGGDDIPF